MTEPERPAFGEIGVSDFNEVQTPGVEQSPLEGADTAAPQLRGSGAAAPGEAGRGSRGERDPLHAPHHVARRAWYGLLTQAVDKVLPVLILLYLARVLEPAAFGVYSFI